MNNLVMVTAVIVGASAEVKSAVVDKKLSARPVLGVFALGIFLYILGMASQDLATKFCYLVIIAALLVNGAPVFEALNPQPKKG
jgi:hypothetical protein